jgi:hypothetical protein
MESVPFWQHATRRLTIASEHLIAAGTELVAGAAAMEQIEKALAIMLAAKAAYRAETIERQGSQCAAELRAVREELHHLRNGRQ